MEARPTFYPSPRLAAQAPPVELAYVVTLNTPSNGDARPDALTVVDLDPGSSTYGTLIGRLDMPDVGDELHHFGWNACSSALCPWALASEASLLAGGVGIVIYVVALPPAAGRSLRVLLGARGD